MNRAVVVGLFLAGCGRAADFSGPAPAGALECALAHGRAAGYELIEGNPQRNMIRLAQRLPPAPAEDRRLRPEPSLGDAVLVDGGRHPVENQIVARVSRGQLQLTLIGAADGGARDGAGSNAEDQARTMLALCTSSPPVLPATGAQVPPVQGPDPIRD
jgi:hypothetical protein